MEHEIEIKIPDIGGANQVDVIEILVKIGDNIRVDTPLITLESDKASMEIPSSLSGVVTKINLKIGDKVSEGDVILLLKAEQSESIPVKEVEAAEQHPFVSNESALKPGTQTPPTLLPNRAEIIEDSALVFAGPAVRRMARDLGVLLSLVKGSGRKSRITKEDVQAHVKSRLSGVSTAPSFSIPSIPAIDFSKFGAIETKALNKIKKITAINVHRSWITIPHVTQFDEADITDLESFRKAEADNAHELGYKLTLLAFVCGVVSKALHVYPQFNSSLDSSGENLVYKKYCNIGIAVETPNGLVVPVIKNTDRLSIADIAKEMSRLSMKARDKGLMPADMSGGCFTISSLGGIGGTAFTPIVNSPEVAILGLSRAAFKPVYDNGEFKPRLMLPLSLSYDHRVIDGAEAARFTRFIVDCLGDMRKVLL